MQFKKAAVGCAVSCAIITCSASAQDSPQVQPAIVAVPVTSTVPVGFMVVPKNTAVPLTVNNEVNSKTVREGDTFSLSVAQDVVLDNYVVIPKGTLAVAEITWRTGKGAFGKSAKMEFAFRHLELGGRRIALEGKHRQEGAGNTGATIGTAIAAGVFSAFVTGKSAVIQKGREFTAHTAEDFNASLPTSAIAAIAAVPTVPSSAGVAATLQGETVQPVSAPAESVSEGAASATVTKSE